MKVLIFCRRKPQGLTGRLTGPRRYMTCMKAALQTVGVSPKFIELEEYDDGTAKELEHSHDIVHTDDPDILMHQLKRGYMPDIVGHNVWAPSKRYIELGKDYPVYPGYSNNPDLMYSHAIWVRNNYQEERFRPSLLSKIRVIQPCIEANKILPASGHAKKYVLWAGSKDRPEKNWALMKGVIDNHELPPGYEWKILSDYHEDDYLEILDQTMIMVYTSRYESFGFQLFQAWSKAVPVIYKKYLWGSFPFNGCGGISLLDEEYSVDGIRRKLDIFFDMNESQQSEIGRSSRNKVLASFLPERMGRELLHLYSQIYESKK